MSAAITSLTLTKEDLLLLIKSEVLDAKLKDLGLLKSHLDSCRADLVRARIVDCSGRLVHKTDMLYSASSGVPSVGRLRSELTAHFEQIEASYCHEVQETINTLAGQRVDEEHLRLGTFSRSPIYFPSGNGGYLSSDATRFGLDGVAFHSRSISCRGPVVGEFFIKNNGNSCSVQNDAFAPVHFLLRNANGDPSFFYPGCGRRPPGGAYLTKDLSHVRHRFPSTDGDPLNFSAFSQYVMGAVRDCSLELVLGSEFFHYSLKGAPWVATFSSMEVKRRFVEFVEILELARKIDSENPGSQHPGLNIANIVTRIMRKSEILRSLEEPHRTSFDKNDWWYLTRNCADSAFSLMAAESVDESQNKVLSDNHTSLVDLIGAPEVLPDEDGEDERLIQLRITTRKAGH